ncbi:MAG: hypothetical protein LBK66_00770 [Spirochaetaceae bacterium]|nr:hypothetical protein [Spirochaetaceae bacterium]
MEKAGRFLDGTAFPGKAVKTYKNSAGLTFSIFSPKDGERYGILALSAAPYIQFYCTEPDEAGLFFITRLHFLFSNLDGWMEGDMDVSGTGVSGTGSLAGTGNFSINGELTIGNITRGSIKRRDRHLSGEQALTELRNRSERIAALTGWMKEQTTPRNEPGILVPLKHFENYWQPILLPETVKAKLRPIGFNALNSAGSNAQYTYGQDIKWNSTYTQELLPEQLRSLRDSGSLLRDWEEAAAWFYIYYNWDTIIKMLNG